MNSSGISTPSKLISHWFKARSPTFEIGLLFPIPGQFIGIRKVPVPAIPACGFTFTMTHSMSASHPLVHHADFTPSITHPCPPLVGRARERIRISEAPKVKMSEPTSGSVSRKAVISRTQRGRSGRCSRTWMARMRSKCPSGKSRRFWQSPVMAWISGQRRRSSAVMASLRVLEKCDFTIISEEPAFSSIGGESVPGYILKLG